MAKCGLWPGDLRAHILACTRVLLWSLPRVNGDGACLFPSLITAISTTMVTACYCMQEALNPIWITTYWVTLTPLYR